jgi:hypothetical protein
VHFAEGAKNFNENHMTKFSSSVKAIARELSKSFPHFFPSVRGNFLVKLHTCAAQSFHAFYMLQCGERNQIISNTFFMLPCAT